MSSLAEVRLSNLFKKFPSGIQALKNLSLEIDDKEFLVLLGPSGCGKTTALRSIAGLETLDSGEIYIGDELVNDIPPKERDTAMVFQSYGLFPHMTVAENIAYGWRYRELKKAEIKKNKMVGRSFKHVIQKTPYELG